MLIDCSICDARVDAELNGSYADWIDNEAGIKMCYDLYICRECKCPSLFQKESYFDSEWSERTRMFPPTARLLGPAIPENLRQSFYEARACAKAKAFTATAIMCRRTLEGICANHGIAEHNLKKKIEGLKNAGVIDVRLFEWAEELRLSGNDAAHDINSTINKQDAEDLLDFTEVLLEQIYVYKKKLDAFRARRAKAPSDVS